MPLCKNINSFSYICINLDYNSDKDIKNYIKDKSIKSFSILVDSKNDVSEHKRKFLKLMKGNKYILRLGVQGLYFDTECIKKISQKKIVQSLGIGKNFGLKFDDDFYLALNKCSSLIKLDLIGFSNTDQLSLLSEHPALEIFNTSYTNVTYDQAMSFLDMPKLEKLSISMRDLTAEQEQNLKQKANSHKSGEVKLDLDKTYSVTK
ncbi:MAG: hypothetical protein ACRYGR_09960 [Janthinobacterium lividum]